MIPYGFVPDVARALVDSGIRTPAPSPAGPAPTVPAPPPAQVYPGPRPAPARALPPQPQGPSVLQSILRALPMVLSGIAAAKGGPVPAAGLLAGVNAGRAQIATDQAAQRAEESARQKEFLGLAERNADRDMRQQAAVSGLMEKATTALGGINDPIEFGQRAAAWDQIGQQVYGLPKGWLANGVAFPDSKIRKTIEDRLDDADKRYVQNGVDPSEISFEIPQKDGTTKRVSYFEAAAISGRGVYDKSGKPIAPPKATKPVLALDPKKRTLTPVGEVPTNATVVQEPQPPRVTVNTTGSMENRVTLADAVRDGRIMPSDLMKRGDYNDILAVADQRSQRFGGKKLNLTKMRLDYEAAKRFVGSLNSERRLTYNSLAQSVVNTIDEVRTLSEELKQGGIQKWNAAKREGLQQIYGNTPYSQSAAKYMTAINTLKEEFAQLASGGYAPTEDAWKLANSQINGNYGVKDLDASLTEVQRLINYRLGAFLDQSPTTLGGASDLPIGEAQYRKPPTPHAGNTQQGLPAGSFKVGEFVVSPKPKK